MNDDRLQREREFHDERFGGDDSAREDANKYYVLMKSANEKYRSLVAGICSGKELLEYGCGTGSESLEWLRLGAKVTGIDISPEAVKKSGEMVSNSGKSAKFVVANAEDTEFEDDTFDVIVGTGIIHHLDLNNAYSEMSRLLKSNGRAVFIEPLGHNPFINLYRYLTPEMRSEDEHPLKRADITLLKKYFGDVKSYHFNLFTFLSIPFRNTGLFKPLYNFLHVIDNLAFYIPLVKMMSWMVIIDVGEPKSK